jgi:transcription initiation factor TFIIIB Brf1 subunit/transcription initiation factor TFIIB
MMPRFSTDLPTEGEDEMELNKLLKQILKKIPTAGMKPPKISKGFRKKPQQECTGFTI